MLFGLCRVRAALLLILLAVPVLAACTSAQAGSAQPAVRSIEPSAPPSTSPSPSPSASASDPVVDSTGGGWTFAHVKFGPDGIPSPTGQFTARLTGGRVCFQPVAEARAGSVPCGALADGDAPVFAVFSPDGKRLLVVAGPDGSQTRSVYVVDSDTAAVRVVGPDAVTDLPDGEPARWVLSSVAWSVDGSSVVIVPHTDGDAGPVLSVDLAQGATTEIARLPADLANGQPSVWTARNGMALVNNKGADRQTLWWLDPATGSVDGIGRFPDESGSLVLSAADPLGRSVLTCPRKVDGRLGATVGVLVASRRPTRVLPDSTSCAGAVFSPDGGHLALTAQLDAGYSLIVMEVSTGRRVLTVPLPVAEPSVPPYLTWLGDVVVAADVSGEWSAPSLVLRLGP